MAAIEYPDELADDQKQLLEKYESIAMNLCSGGSATYYAALGTLLKVGYINKDLDLAGIQTITTTTNLLQCVQHAVGCCRNACLWAHYLLLDNRANLIQSVGDSLKNKDIEALKQKCEHYKNWLGELESNLQTLEVPQTYVAEIYTRYITTQGSFKDEVIEVLAAVRQEQKQWKATWSYIHSLLTIISALFDQVCANDLHIPAELLVKFYIHAAFINELRKTQEDFLAFDLSNVLSDLSVSTTFDEKYLKFQAKCIDGEEKMKELIAERKKGLQVQMRDGICVWEN